MKIHTIQFNIEAFLGGTCQMDATELGAYVSLLVACYQSKDNSLIMDDVRLARIAKCSPKVWGRIREIVLSKFDEENGKITQKRVLEDAQSYLSKSTKNRDNALKRWETHKPIALPSQSVRNANKEQRTNTSSKKALSDDDYWIAGQVIKITEEDRNAWVAKYPNLTPDEIDEIIISRDKWLASQEIGVRKSWFMSTQKYLHKLNGDAA